MSTDLHSGGPLWNALLAPHAESDKTFLELSDGTVVSYRDSVARALKGAGALVAAGVKPGDRVAVQVEKSPEALTLYFACLAAGAALLPLNTAYTAAEIAYFVGDAEPALVVCDPAKADAIRPIADKAGAGLLTLGIDGTGTLTDAITAADAIAPVARTDDDLAGILYTSGTTGRSKGAMTTQRNLLSNAEALRDLWRFTADDVLLHALPIYHTHGLFVATNTLLAAGGSMIFLPKFDLDAVVKALPRATAMMGVPTFYTRMLDDPRFDKALVSNMRLFISGSAPLLAETHKAFEARTGHRILERYGMTETNMNTSNPYEGDRRAGTVGKPLPGVELRIINPETAAEQAQGEIGEIEVRGPNVFKGYWRMPEKTAEEMRPDGFFRTGDLAQLSEDGYVSIVGRAKDLIISGGLNIYPKEIEGVIDDLDGVLESAVIGVPHPDFGEAVVAVVVRDRGGKALDEEAVIGGVKGQLAAFKRPKKVFFVDALPRNAMGKVQKKALRDEHAALFG